MAKGSFEAHRGEPSIWFAASMSEVSSIDLHSFHSKNKTTNLCIPKNHLFLDLNPTPYPQPHHSWGVFTLSCAYSHGLSCYSLVCTITHVPFE